MTVQYTFGKSLKKENTVNTVCSTKIVHILLLLTGLMTLNLSELTVVLLKNCITMCLIKNSITMDFLTLPIKLGQLTPLASVMELKESTLQAPMVHISTTYVRPLITL